VGSRQKDSPHTKLREKRTIKGVFIQPLLLRIRPREEGACSPVGKDSHEFPGHFGLKKEDDENR